MASRKPLVMNNGAVQQLQAGDTLAISEFGGVRIISQVNDESGNIVCGMPVYNDAVDGVKKAKADASGTINVIGLVNDATIATTVAGNIAIEGVLVLTTTQWDAVFGTTGGLTVGTVYFLSDATAGNGAAAAPSTVGHYVVKIGIALSTTELKLSIGSAILL